jgi:hypothetical protein
MNSSYTIPVTGDGAGMDSSYAPPSVDTTVDGVVGTENPPPPELPLLSLPWQSKYSGGDALYSQIAGRRKSTKNELSLLYTPGKFESAQLKPQDTNPTSRSES